MEIRESDSAAAWVSVVANQFERERSGKFIVLGSVAGAVSGVQAL